MYWLKAKLGAPLKCSVELSSSLLQPFEKGLAKPYVKGIGKGYLKGLAKAF